MKDIPVIRTVINEIKNKNVNENLQNLNLVPSKTDGAWKERKREREREHERERAVVSTNL